VRFRMTVFFVFHDHWLRNLGSARVLMLFRLINLHKFNRAFWIKRGMHVTVFHFANYCRIRILLLLVLIVKIDRGTV
jgi:hypothetical protein